MATTAGTRRGETWRATAPVRADLAGGTLDLWPLGLLHEGACTVAAALSLRVEATAGPAPRRGALRLASRDLGAALDRPRDARGARRGKLELLERIARLCGPAEGTTLTSFSPLAAGSGLGTSSALGVAAAAAATRLAGRPARRGEIVPLVRDVEAQLLGIPTGTQDHEAAWLGGLVVVEQRPGGALAQRLDDALLAALAERLVVVDSGKSRCSGPSNWDMFRRRLDGDRAAKTALARVARAGSSAAAALDAADWRKLGRAMQADLAARREWSPLVLTERLAALNDAALAAGAWGFKVCGAGGGGYAIALAAPERRGRVTAALVEAGAAATSARPSARGLVLKRLAAGRER